MEGQQFRAAENIGPALFVTISGDNAISVSAAGEQAIGIMHESSWDTPIPGADPLLAVPAGQSKRVYQENEVCEVMVGTGGLTAGQFVKPDAVGKGVAAVATDRYSAICIQGGIDTERAKVVVSRGAMPET